MKTHKSNNGLLWSGKPHRWKFITRIKYGVPLPLVVALLFLKPTAWSFQGKPHILSFVLLFIVLFGLYGSIGRFLVAAYDWRNTEYFLRQGEVIMTYGVLRKKTKRIPIDSFDNVRVVDTVQENKIRIGSVVLGNWSIFSYYWTNSVSYLSLTRTYEGVWFAPALLYIERPEEVAELTRSLRDSEQL